MKKPNTYKCTTVKDIFELIPAGKIDEFLIDFKNALTSYNLLDDGLKKMISTNSFTWVEDGKNDETMRITLPDGDVISTTLKRNEK